MQISNVCTIVYILFVCYEHFGGSVSGNEYKMQSSVLELTDTTFEAVISTHDHILIDFYAPWCGHCKRFSPELDAAAPGLAQNTPPILIAKLNADKYTRIASKYGINAYPTLKFFINGFPSDYNGPLKAATLSSHLKKLAGPDIEVIQDEVQLEHFVETSDKNFPFFMLFGMGGSVILQHAKQYKSRAWFLVVESFSERLMEKYDFDKSTALVVLRTGAREHEVYYGPFEGDDLSVFIRQSILPRVTPLTMESVRKIQEDGRPVALAILRDELSYQSMAFVKKLKAAAPANRDFVFAYVDILKWPSFLATLHIDTQSKVPHLMVWDGGNKYFEDTKGYDFGSENAESYITFFLQEFKEGKAKSINLKGPSLRDFISSLISIKGVYILIFVMGVIFFAQNMWVSESRSIAALKGNVETRDNSSSGPLDSNISVRDKED